ncbi:MAG TPA: transcription antitermination factor NusB [Nitrospirota bacterium]|jgi:N utilization substance protein B
MGSRRKARELALQYLYKLDVSGDKFNKIAVRSFFEDFSTTDEDLEYSYYLLDYTDRHKAEIDEAITRYLENWTLERLSAIDRNILRFAACELIYFMDVPVNVTINEAIEIAKKFSLEESATFINGVLDKIGKASKKGQQ